MEAAGDRAQEYAVDIAAIAQAGGLEDFIQGINELVSSQAGEFQTVSGAIADYQKEIEGLTSGADTHETMVSIYDEFAEAVNKGQINTEKAREQM